MNEENKENIPGPVEQSEPERPTPADNAQERMERVSAAMTVLGGAIDRTLEEANDARMGYSLIVYNPLHPTGINYVSNCGRQPASDAIGALVTGWMKDNGVDPTGDDPGEDSAQPDPTEPEKAYPAINGGGPDEASGD